MPNLLLEIVTVERLVSSEEVSAVVAPGVEGEMTILPRHAPLLTQLRPGELRVVKDGTEDNYIAVSGGFIEVIGDKVTVLADAAEREEEIDFERAQVGLKRAQERVANSGNDLDLERAMTAMRRSQVRLNIAGRRHRRTRTDS